MVRRHCRLWRFRWFVHFVFTLFHWNVYYPNKFCFYQYSHVFLAHFDHRFHCVRYSQIYFLQIMSSYGWTVLNDLCRSKYQSLDGMKGALAFSNLSRKLCECCQMFWVITYCYQCACVEGSLHKTHCCAKYRVGETLIVQNCKHDFLATYVDISDL